MLLSLAAVVIAPAILQFASTFEPLPNISPGPPADLFQLARRPAGTAWKAVAVLGPHDSVDAKSARSEFTPS